MIALKDGYKDGADCYTSQMEDNKLMETDASVLWGKMSRYVTSIENFYGSPSPDLGYIKKIIFIIYSFADINNICIGFFVY